MAFSTDSPQLQPALAMVGAVDQPAALLQPLLPWWRALPREGRLPVWCGELVFDLKPWLAYLLMARFPRTGAAPRYTLYGPELVQFTGCDLTGRGLHDASAAAGFRQTADSYVQACEAARPHWSRVRVDLPCGNKLRYDRLLLPFTCADGDARVLGAIRFDMRLPRAWGAEEMSLTIEQEALLV